jgi:uncharacterized RDD family membrane protein YckC
LARNGEPEWDQLSIETPELVSIDMPVAGIGSRFVALLVDYLIWLIALILLVIVVSVVDPSLSHFSELGEKWATAIVIFVLFFWFWGYFTLFEAFWDGRTPGKRLAKIRVIQRTGRGIGLFESMTRNFLRIIDQFPLIYAVGVVSIFFTRQHQRLGDLAAGTLVVHDRENLSASRSSASGRTLTAGIFGTASTQPEPGTLFDRRPVVELATSGINLLGVDDLEVLEGFFARRLDFTVETRALLAKRIAGAIQAKSGLEVPPAVSTEAFLEEVARRLRDGARMRSLGKS